MAYIIIIIIIIALTFIIKAIYEDYSRKQYEEEKEARIKKEKDLIPSKILEFNNMLNELYSKYGEPAANICCISINVIDLSLNMSKDDYNRLFGYRGYSPETIIRNSFIIFESSQTIFLYNNPYSFKDIISFEVFDNSSTINKGSIDTQTKTKTSSMLGRAVVGGVLAGGAGAVIGGLTAKQNSQSFNNTSTETKHNYYINITINDLKNPIVKIALLEDREKMEKISSLLSIIIANKE